jgi:hypothetical protein
MRLKRWESPRREGRNDKGRGGAARARQLKKQAQMMRQKLKSDSKAENSKNNRNKEGQENKNSAPLLFGNRSDFSLAPFRKGGEQEKVTRRVTPYCLLPLNALSLIQLISVHLIRILIHGHRQQNDCCTKHNEVALVRLLVR